MKKSMSFLFFFVMLISACSPPPAIATPLPTIASTPTAETPPELPFSQPGNYLVGVRRVEFVDESRDGRKVGVVIWYPAAPGQGEPGEEIKDAAPDLSAAPYPMILSASKDGFIFAPHLVSHGFTYVGVTRIDTYARMTTQMYDQPLDLLFALDMMTSQPPPELEGVLDTDHVGVTGYSFDGYNTYALSGARIDPDYYLAQCPNPDDVTKSILSDRLSSFNCSPAGAWEEFEAGVDENITTSEDGMWQAMTDERIRAVLPMAGEGWWLFGERGLAAVDRPVLMIVATEDELYSENALIFEHLGTPDKTFISFLGLTHMMIYDLEPTARMAHFAVAFFGYHLQGRQEYQTYFSRDFIASYPDLAWGVVQK